MFPSKREREKVIERVPSLVLPGEESEAMADRRIERDGVRGLGGF